MPKKKSGARHTSKKSADKRADPRKQGMRAFSANSFDAAIARWSELDQRDPQVQQALAEAYFRRGLGHDDADARVADMRQASERAPQDMRYRYHLAMALHRTGDVEQARSIYHEILSQKPKWHGVAMTLALAELARNSQVDLGQLPGSTPQIVQTLAPVQALLRGETPPDPGDINEGLPYLWYGLGLLASGDAAAGEVLSDERWLPSETAEAVQQYYRGVAAARADESATAVQVWRAALEHAPARSPLPMPWMIDNLVAVLVPYLGERLEADDVQAVRQTAQWISRSGLRHNALNPLLVQALDRAAQAEAREGNWQQAALLWEDARQIVSSSSSLGSPRTLLHNLALAYEALEEWVAAAETWRAMLRTRSRKAKSKEEKAADPMDYTDEQWAWIRKRVVSCYQHAGEPGEAVKIFRQAVKSEPDDLDMRLQLADALLANQQEQASINELNRILERNPKHIDANLRLADIYVQLSDSYYDWQGYWSAAERALRVVLEQQPERADVRRQIARLMLARGNTMHMRGKNWNYPQWIDMAEQIFKEGREFAPDDYQFPLNLARIEIDRGHPEKAAPLLEQTLEIGQDTPKAYMFVIDCWVVADHLDRAREVLERARRELTLTVDFYLDLATTLLSRSAPPLPPYGVPMTGIPEPEEGPVLDMVRESVQHAVELKPDDPHVRFQLASTLLSLQPALALEQAQEGVRLLPDEPAGMLLLGVLQGLNDQKREAKATLRRTASMARKKGDYDMAEQADMMREQVGSPFFKLSLTMGHMFDDDIDDYYL